VKNLDEMTLEQVSDWMRNHMTSDMLKSLPRDDLTRFELMLSHWQQMATRELSERAKR